MTDYCDHCGKPERFNVLCPDCEAVTCDDCGRVVCCCEGQPPCAWCGKTYDEHLAMRAADVPAPRMPCGGLRACFLREELTMSDDNGAVAPTEAPKRETTIHLGEAELRIDGKPVQLDVTLDVTNKLDPKVAVLARRALSRFIEDAERAAEEAWDEGRSGYLGRIKFCAFVDDDGVSLRVERSLSEDL